MRKQGIHQSMTRRFVAFSAALALPLGGLFVGVAAEQRANAAEIETGLHFDQAFAPYEAERGDLVMTPSEILEAESLSSMAPRPAEPVLAEPEDAGSPIGTGVASYYGKRFAGRPTASGELFDPGKLTAAHRTLPFGSRVKVTNTRTGRSVVVRINDRGPFVRGRSIDLSRSAAEKIGLVQQGHGTVAIALLD